MSIYDDSRSAWGARPARKRRTAPIRSRTVLMSHWNGPKLGITAKTPHATCLSTVRNFQQFHQNERGWSDIGYNYLICPHGRIIEGRGRDAIGAHCTGWNTIGIGVQFMMGQGDSLNLAMRDAFVRLRSRLNLAAGKNLTLMVHSQGQRTECPGPLVRSYIASVGKSVPTIKLGSTGSRVKTLQSGLLKHFPSQAKPIKDSGGVDGKFGPGTEAAVKKVQKKLGLEVDGKVGPLTQAALKTYGISFT